VAYPLGLKGIIIGEGEGIPRDDFLEACEES
jgi:hypothetical protein